jgi:hypothetical protein
MGWKTIMPLRELAALNTAYTDLGYATRFWVVSWLEAGSVKAAFSRLAHKHLDEAVFAAYGWNPDLSDEEILEKLLSLNLERSR